MESIFNFNEEDFDKYQEPYVVKIGWQKQVEDSLGISDLTNYGYISGYKSAADELLKMSINNGSSEESIFPIVLNMHMTDLYMIYQKCGNILKKF